MNIQKTVFGKLDTTEVYLYTLTNSAGLVLKVTEYGATITSLLAPNQHGILEDIVLGFNTLDDYTSEAYKKAGYYLGCVAGRYANRIANGKFTLEGKEYTLAVNNGVNHLHGGIKGFDKQIWTSEEVKGDDFVGVKLSYLSKAMEEGYPANLSVSVTYKLTNANELKLEYEAQSDASTVLNLTNHSYFNLSGTAEPITDHLLTIFTEYYTERNEVNIPTGKIKSVKGTALDFTSARKIGEKISEYADGYDHNFVLNNGGRLALAAKAIDEKSGRKLEFYTTEPGTQLYTGFYLNGTLGDGKRMFNQFSGFCFEAQHYPNSPNTPEFPSTVLKKGETYRQTTVYKMSTI